LQYIFNISNIFGCCFIILAYFISVFIRVFSFVHISDRFACYSRDYHGSGVERPRWANYEDFEEDVDDIGDGGFKDEIIGHREGFWQPRNQRDFMYFDEVLWQKKRRIQKERWYQMERNKEISVLKKGLYPIF
jgi:hypothetical protein